MKRMDRREPLTTEQEIRRVNVVAVIFWYCVVVAFLGGVFCIFIR